MRRWPLHPLLVAIFPTVTLFSERLHAVPWSDFVRPALGVVIIAFALWLVTGLLLRSVVRGALATTAFLFVLLGYEDVSRLLLRLPEPFRPGVAALAFGLVVALAVRSSKILAAVGSALAALAVMALARPLANDKFSIAALWCLVSLVAAVAAARSYNDLKVSKAFTIGTGFLVAFALAMTGFKLPAHYKAMAALEHGLPPVLSRPVTKKPDIYVLVMDGYGRADALDETFMFDNRPFLRKLTKLGFTVGKRSRANYAQTEQAIASALNLDYLSAVAPNVEGSSNDRIALQRLIADNRTKDFLTSLGYAYQPISSGFYGFNQPSIRPTWSDPLALNHVESLILHQTPEMDLGIFSDGQHQSHRNRLNQAFDRVAGANGGKPLFTVAHILAPHPPFVFDERGAPLNPERPFGLWDCQFFVRAVGSRAEYLVGYPKQLEHVNTRIMRTVEKILASSKEPPIIVLLGDHGSRLGLHSDKLEETDVPEAYRNLTAIYASPRLRAKLDPNQTPINVMRAVLREALGADLPLLPDRSYFSNWNTPFRFVDVSSQIGAS